MIAQSSILLALIATVFAATYFGTRAAIRALQGRAILDRPNARSSHAVPTPRGGGLALVPAVLAAWLVVAQASGGLDTEFLAVLLGAVLLGAVSWLDDLRGLPVLVRLAAQAAAIGTVLTASGEPPVFGGLLPGWADALAAGLVWLWFVNLYNFMDGIDGLAGTETASIGIGVAAVAAIAGLSLEPIAYGLAVAAAAAAFLIWNWQPARVFLG
ncbi:MAG: glycosyl transferase, partial [Alphaproteobacteria bacterium]|nr:glycosyl transferase [Alphaproteobacteria bacterium]